MRDAGCEGLVTVSRSQKPSSWAFKGLTSLKFALSSPV